MMKYPGYIARVGWPIISSYWWIRKYAKHPEKYTMEEKYGRLRKLIARVAKGLNLEIYVKGLDNIPTDGNSFVITPNHLSMIDPFILFMYVSTPLSFVGKQQIIKYPFVGKCMKMLESIFLDRSDLRQNLTMMRTITKTLKENTHSWVIYPEGTRTRNEDYSMNEMKPGSFKMALDSGRTIVPVAFFGTFRVLSTKYKNKINPIQISFLEPLTSEQFKNMKTLEVASIIQERVETELNLLREKDKVLMEEIASRKKKKKVRTKRA